MALSITILEVSGNVVVTASGSINLSGLTFVALTGGGSAFVNPSGAVIVSSAVGFDMDSYNGNSTILNLGSGGFTSASSYSGDDFGIAAAGNEIYVRQGYVSNTPINGTITFNGTNFTTMGFTQGTYTSSWASDSVTIQVGLPPSPTPTNTQTPTVTPTNTPTPTSTPQPNSIEITSVNYVGQIADITYTPCSGGTISLGSHVIPYTFQSFNYTGQYSLYFSAFNSTCSYEITCPTPTVTPTNTETPTNTPTNTPTPTRTSTTPTPTATLTQTPSPTPYTTLAGSLLFNGSNQSLGISPGVTFGAGSFTLEGWFYNNDLFTNKGIVGSPVTSPTGCMNLYFANGTTITSDRNGGGGSFSYTMSSSITANQWHYLIYNRNADGTTAVYIDGVRCTATSLDTLNYTTATDTIGRYYGGYWPGYWTNMRMTIGTAVYNSNLTTQSTPRGPLTSLANTKYLMLGDVVTTDSSGTQTVTNNNGVTQTSDEPF